MPNKKIFLGIFVLVLGFFVFSSSTRAASPWDTLWAAIEEIRMQIVDLQDQITNIELVPGPAGESGPIGPVGPTGAPGPMGPAGTSHLVRYIVVGITTIPGNSAGEAIANCQPGDQVLAGGFDSGGSTVTQSRPALVSEGWLASGHTSGDLIPRNLRAYAWCNDLTP